MGESYMYQRLPYARAEGEGEDEEERSRRIGGQMVKRKSDGVGGSAAFLSLHHLCVNVARMFLFLLITAELREINSCFAVQTC